MQLSATALILAASTAAAAPLNKLALVDFAQVTAKEWSEQNDPVMGGQSSGNFTLVKQGTESHALFQGVVRNVSFLHAPGFCTLRTIFPGGVKKDASAYLGGAVELVVKDIGLGVDPYDGFKVALSSTGAARHHGGHELFGMYKANLDMGLRLPCLQDKGWECITIPLKKFSSDWSDATGECATKDPDGYQHVCCETGSESVCPSKSGLAAINGLSVWAEGVEGPFALEVKSISVVKV